MASQIVGKISPKTVMGTDRTAPKADQGTILLYRVGGIATGFDTGEDKFAKEKGEEGKEWTKLIGEFMAKRYDNGEVFTSGECFLPGSIAKLVASQIMRQAPNATGQTDGVNFVFDIGYKYDAQSAKNYVYVVSNPTDNEADSAVAKLIASAPPPKALPYNPNNPTDTSRLLRDGTKVGENIDVTG